MFGVSSFMKIGALVSFGTKFCKFVILGQGHQFQLLYNYHVRLVVSAKFHKSTQVLNFGSRSTISTIIFMINELDLLWLANFIALRIYFISGTKFSWNGGVDTCFNVEYVLLGRNFDFLGGYSVVTARYLVVIARYLVVTARYFSLLLVPTFSMNGIY